MLIVLSTGSAILKLESTIYEFSLIFRVLLHFEKNWSVPLILKYHQIGCFLHYPRELFCLTNDVSKLSFSCLFFFWNSPANISTSDRRCSQRYTTLIQCRCPTLKQCRYNDVHCRIDVISRSYNVVSTLIITLYQRSFNVASTFSNLQFRWSECWSSVETDLTLF